MYNYVAMIWLFKTSGYENIYLCTTPHQKAKYNSDYIQIK